MIGPDFPQRVSSESSDPNNPTGLDVGAFPAAPGVPGQAESRTSLQRFLEMQADCPWFESYTALRRDGWTWRLAAYIAWASCPVKGRWPATVAELATNVLGLRSDRVIRKWRVKRPEIDERVGMLQVEPLLKHRADVIAALIEVAETPDPKAHQDRRLYFEMTGDYKPRQRLDVGMTDEELDGAIEAELERLRAGDGQ